MTSEKDWRIEQGQYRGGGRYLRLVHIPTGKSRQIERLGDAIGYKLIEQWRREIEEELLQIKKQ